MGSRDMSRPSDALGRVVPVLESFRPGLVERVDDKVELLGIMFCAAGAAVEADRVGSQSHPQWRRLLALVAMSLEWARLVAADDVDVVEAMRAEYDRAHAKHRGMTPLHPSLVDAQRAPILLEEVGEVARCLTPDAAETTGHAGELFDELIQVAAMAAAWASRLMDDAGVSLVYEDGAEG